jgi:hypothetical protein
MTIRERSERRRRRAFWPVLAVVAVLGAGALVFADVPHTFTNGETLTADNLNQNFAALNAKEPFAGTYPAVVGLGTAPWFCGAAPATLNLSSVAPTAANYLTSSNAFGGVIFTNGGILAINQSLGVLTTSSTQPSSICPTGAMCASPVTFFLKSPTAQTLVIKNFVDDVGSIYVDGAAVASGLGSTQNTTSISVPAGSFALSFLACSSNGPTLWVDVYDSFLTNPAYGLTVDYDRTFHRNGN